MHGLYMMSLFISRWLRSNPQLSQLIDMLLKSAAKVSGFILRNNVLATKTLQKGTYLVVRCLSFGLIGHLANLAYCIAACLRPIAILKSSFLRLTNSLQG